MFKLNLTNKTPVLKKLNQIRLMASTADDVIFESVGKNGVITLNRPKALNALNLSMVKKILPTLEKWENEKNLVIVKGAGGRAFCAGGDVKEVVESNIRGERLGETFFRWEYTTNGLIGNYKIPYIALIDGVTMGGGVGLSVHGRYRVATEKTLFAMPETQIALFPDVGGSYFLPKLCHNLGLFLALTGYRLKGIDNLAAGIATHFVHSSKIGELEKEILKECENDNDVKQVLEKYNTKEDVLFSLCDNMEQINHCFGGRTIEDILDRLKQDGSDWANNTLKILTKMSPTSLKVTKALLDKTSKENLSLEQCLILEYRLACHTLSRKEFNEGVRAKLIDKDDKPKWNPPTLAEVTLDMVKNNFKPLQSPNEELKFTKSSHL